MEALAKSDFSTLVTLHTHDPGGKQPEEALIFSLCLSASFPNIPHSPDTPPGRFCFKDQASLCFGPSRESSGITCLVRHFHPCLFFSHLAACATFPNFGLSAFPYKQTILTSNSQEIGLNHPFPPLFLGICTPRILCY